VRLWGSQFSGIVQNSECLINLYSYMSRNVRWFVYWFIIPSTLKEIQNFYIKIFFAFIGCVYCISGN
jgi:hypothetical protein